MRSKSLRSEPMHLKPTLAKSMRPKSAHFTSIGRRVAFIFAALCGLALWLTASASRIAAADLQTLEIASRSGVHTFAVEMALTPEQQAQGLMFRKELPEGQGMLFDFRREQESSFWMKNTLIPLDMIFIRADGRI